MSNPKVSIIVAMASNRAIGQKGKLLWSIPAELKRFQEVTTGHPIIMGRKTHESIGRPLPDRDNIIITGDPNYESEECLVVHSFEEALETAGRFEKEEIFIIGGGEVYSQALSVTDKLYLTIVDGEFPEADTFFPEFTEFTKVISEEIAESDGYKYKFLELEK